MDLRDLLIEVHETQGGLTAPLVVAAATPEDHPLHSHFEWDDKVAGPQYREIQARRLIRSVRIVTEVSGEEQEQMMSVRAFVSTPDGAGHRKYVPTEEAMMDDMQLAIVLRDMYRRWQDLRAAYGHMEAFAEMIRKDKATG